MTKVWLNLTGTTAPTFSLGKGGPTIRRGTAVPDNSMGADGDLYVQTGSAPGFYQRVSGIWRSLVPSDFQRQSVAQGATATVGFSTTYVAIGTGTAAQTTITLPSGVEGKQITFKDETGSAQTYNIVIKDAGGVTTATIATGYGAVTLIYTNNNWYAIRKVTT